MYVTQDMMEGGGDYLRNKRHDGGMVGRGGGATYLTQDMIEEWWGGLPTSASYCIVKKF